MVLLSMGSEKIEPNKELIEFTRKILEQNAAILRMNEQLLKFLSPVCHCEDLGKKDLRDLSESIKDK